MAARLREHVGRNLVGPLVGETRTVDDHLGLSQVDVLDLGVAEIEIGRADVLVAHGVHQFFR